MYGAVRVSTGAASYATMFAAVKYCAGLPRNVFAILRLIIVTQSFLVVAHNSVSSRRVCCPFNFNPFKLSFFHFFCFLCNGKTTEGQTKFQIDCYVAPSWPQWMVGWCKECTNAHRHVTELQEARRHKNTNRAQRNKEEHRTQKRKRGRRDRTV